MTNRFKFWLITVLTLIVLTGIYFAGWFTYRNTHPPPVFTSSHTVVYDTASKHIYHIYPWYTEKLVSKTYRDKAWIDSIKNANQLDSAGINFYATYQYNRMIADIDSVTKDTSLIVKWSDAISQNKAMPVNGFDYKYIRPTYITENIDKSVNYNKYLLFGISTPFKDMSYGMAELTVVAPKWYVGAGYMPKMQSVTVKAGITLFKIK